MQLFFMLSGYFVAQGLERSRGEDGRVRLWGHYRRRATHIWPLYFVYLGGLGVFFLLTGSPVGLERVWPALAGFSFNYYVWSTHMPLSLVRYVDHLWSLCASEQMCLLWPLVALAVPGRHLWRVCLAVVIAGPLLRWAMGAYLLGHGVEESFAAFSIYTSTFTHLDAFCGGALIALLAVPERLPKPWRWAAAAITLEATIMALTYNYLRPLGADADITFHFYFKRAMADGQHIWNYTLLNLCMFALITALLAPDGGKPNWIKRLLGHPWMVWIGGVSYGIYVLHYPMVEGFHMLARHIGVNVGYRAVPWVAWTGCGLFIILMCGIGYLAKRYVQQPMATWVGQWLDTLAADQSLEYINRQWASLGTRTKIKY